eukprot:gene9599-1801_t
MSASHVSKEVKTKAKFIQLSSIKYKDEEGVDRFWDCCDRTTTKGEIDAVEIIATINYKDGSKKLILAKQYRPPLQCYSIEFPAGLVDEGETAEEAALRELKEETGYIGKCVKTSPVLAYEPGLTSSRMKVCYIEVDAELNKNPKPELDEGEHVQAIIVDKSDLLKILEEESSKGVSVDAKLYTFALQ